MPPWTVAFAMPAVLQNLFLRSTRIHIKRWFQSSAMARSTIDQRIAILKSIYISQLIGDDRVRHLRHIARNLLRWLVVLGPLADDVAVRATRAQRFAVTDLHNLQQISRRHTAQNLNVFKHRFRRLIFLAGDQF